MNVLSLPQVCLLNYTKNYLYVKFCSCAIPNIRASWFYYNCKHIYNNKGSKLDPKFFRPSNYNLKLYGKTIYSTMRKTKSFLWWIQHLEWKPMRFYKDLYILLYKSLGFRKEYSTINNLFIIYSLFEILKLKKKKKYFVHLLTSKRLLILFGAMHL